VQERLIQRIESLFIQVREKERRNTPSADRPVSPATLHRSAEITPMPLFKLKQQRLAIRESLFLTVECSFARPCNKIVPAEISAGSCICRVDAASGDCIQGCNVSNPQERCTMKAEKVNR